MGTVSRGSTPNMPPGLNHSFESCSLHSVAEAPNRATYTERSHSAWPVSGLNLLITNLSALPFFLIEPRISYS